MLMISNEKLIRELIKRDYEFSLDRIQEVSDIIRIAKIKNLEEWDFLMGYLNEYTQKCINEGFTWNLDYSIDTYAKYLKTFSGVGRKVVLYPNEDIFYLVSGLEAKREALVDEVKITNKYGIVKA